MIIIIFLYKYNNIQTQKYLQPNQITDIVNQSILLSSILPHSQIPNQTRTSHRRVGRFSGEAYPVMWICVFATLTSSHLLLTPTLNPTFPARRVRPDPVSVCLCSLLLI